MPDFLINSFKNPCPILVFVFCFFVYFDILDFILGHVQITQQRLMRSKGRYKEKHNFIIENP